MSTLNYLCLNDVSDDDCYKCMKHGIVLRCPAACPDFDDRRKYMTPKQLEERAKLMEMMGLRDDC